MKIVTWNVRELGGWGKVNMVQKLVREKQVSFIRVTETKNSSFNRILAAKLWGGSNFNWSCVDANNSIGGIVNLWDEEFGTM